jgi:parallel beta-helix repeat protein
MRNNSRSIYLLNTENSRIDNVTILNSLYGILMENSSSNMLTNSSIMNNSNGVYVQGAKNKLINNKLSGNNEGISLWDSYENILSDNDLLSNTYNGLTIYSGGNNLIYHNNIRFSYDDSYNTSWDSGYPGGGNYWSGYYFADNFRGAYQDKPGSDGIGDVPFNIPGGANARDRYPFMRMNGWRSQLPIADCGADLLRCENVGSPVQFNGSESYDPDGAIVSYYWDFGDGMNGMDAELMHKYTSYRWNGTAYLPFIANLVVSDNDGLTNSTLQKVVIWMAGDANGDGKVNILDASLVGLKWGTVDPCADLNNDGKVNILDASIIGLNWGKIPLIQ